MKNILACLVLVCLPSFALGATQAQCDTQYWLMIDAKIAGENAMTENNLIEDDIEVRKASAHAAYAQYKMEHGTNPPVEGILADADQAFDLGVEYNGDAFDNYSWGIGEQGLGEDWYSTSQWDLCLPRYEEAEDWYAGMIFWYDQAIIQFENAYYDYNRVIELCQ